MLADALRLIAGQKLVDTDGDETVLELLPPATAEQLRALEASLPAPLPEEMRAALAVTTGIANGPLESFSLLDLEGFGLEDVFRHAYSIAHDGYGNYWVLDLLPDVAEWGPVFFACHDPAVIAFQAPSVDAFVREMVAKPPDARDSAINQVHEDVVHQLWKDHSGLIPQPVAVISSDGALSEFASTLPSEAVIADLRAPRLGSGFSWGLYGPRRSITRFGTQRLWAITAPPERPGFFARIFGR